MMMNQPLIQTNTVDATTTRLSKSLSFNKKKRVLFSKRVQIKKIPHIKDMKQDMNITNIWYTSAEIDEIRCERKTIIDQMNAIQEEGVSSDMNIDNKQRQEQKFTISTRGLENYTKIGREHRQRRKSKVIQAVLKAQYFQRLLGMDEPKILAAVSRRNSIDSKALANSFAIQDYSNDSI